MFPIFHYHWFFWLFVVCFILHEGWEIFLTYLNSSHTKKNRDNIPEFYRNKIELFQYHKSIDYTLEKAQFGLIVTLIQIPLIWSAILLGGFGALDDWLSNTMTLGPLTHSVVYCVSIGLILMIVQIPLSLYTNFVIEEKYGFNKLTLKTFIVDLIKSLLLGALLGIPILFLVFWFYQKSGDFWWFYAFLALFGFQLFIAAIYPTFLAPIFNKFTLLPDGELKDAILNIAAKIKFNMSGVYTMDGSKRSTHSNAYFAGIGKMRRIVLFDTIMKQMNTKEIISVLTHEMGHNKKKHIQKNLILSFFTSLVGFWIFSILIDWDPFCNAFNAGSPAPHKALILASLFSGYFTFFLTPLMNHLSRKHEYEADRFSVEATNDKESMASALVKLSKENLSNLTPHPMYSFYTYSHPTTVERVKAIQTVP